MLNLSFVKPRWSIICLFALISLAYACSTTRVLGEDEYRLEKNTIEVNGKGVSSSSLTSYLRQKPNTSFIGGWNPLVSIYNWPGHRQNGLARFIRKMGQAPVVYDPLAVEESILNLENHLTYIGYYGSKVRSELETRGKRVRVHYFVDLGRPYEISSLDFHIPQYGTFPEDFEADRPNITLAPGQQLSEEALEAETVRGAQFFRRVGYYGFNKSFYSFEADTLAEPGKARLTLSILDYPRTGSASNAAPHKRFRIGEVHINHPQNIPIRSRVLQDLNTLKPGDWYDEQEVNTTYRRMTNLTVFNSVNVDMTAVSDTVVNCDIRLRSTGGLQGVKVNLESSVNSTGLVGFSPQLTYTHKNIFHGGEVLNVGFKGNFQVKPGTDIRSTEISTSVGIRLPRSVGFANSLFKGPNIPHTDINAGFSYQDRPEYNRKMGNLSMGYVGAISSQWFYQVYPFQMNAVYLSNVSEDFAILMESDRLLSSTHRDHFDLGAGGSLYFTTDPSAIPKDDFSFYRLSMETAGNVMSLFNGILPVDPGTMVHTLFSIPYSQYFKWEFQLGSTFFFGKNRRQSMAFRLMAGAAHAYGNSYYIPFEKQFYAGGANSMRGWQARTLGPGFSPILEYYVIPSQSGDMKLEANWEYRFPVFWKLEGALFVDIGNIWMISDEPTLADVSFSLDQFAQSLAANWGIGARINLDFILVRLDLGIKVRDPAWADGGAWIRPAWWLNKGNFALHFGVGYPF